MEPWKQHIADLARAATIGMVGIRIDSHAPDEAVEVRDLMSPDTRWLIFRSLAVCGGRFDLSDEFQLVELNQLGPSRYSDGVEDDTVLTSEGGQDVQEVMEILVRRLVDVRLTEFRRLVMDARLGGGKEFVETRLIRLVEESEQALAKAVKQEGS